MNTEEFIEKAKLIHGDKYDYSLSNYNRISKIKIICPIHGEFEQWPHDHLDSHGCPSCAGCKRLTTEEFIKKAKLVHGDKYDYSLVDYKNSSTKIKIICPEHGIFEQTPNSHLRKNGCPSCSNTKHYSADEFIEKAKLIHGDKYDYSLVNYKNNHSKIKVVCPIHGEFEISATHFLSGEGCKKCGIESMVKKQSFTTEEFIEKAKLKHGDKYDYSITKYISMKYKIKYICPEHGIVEQEPQSHLSGNGCRKCADKLKSLKNTQTQEKFIERAKQIHGDKYDYSLVNYKGCNEKVKIICPTHGIFEQTARDHYRGSGCPKCRESHGARATRKFLISNKINFKAEHIFETCKYKDYLKFDFYLPEYNTVIEFQGEQHFKSVEYWGGDEDFEIRKKRDETKRNWCLKNDVKLIELLTEKEIPEKLNFLIA